MKIITKIRAFFNVKGEAKEMEVISAEIKQGRVFLHPSEDSRKVFSIKTDNVDIFINPLAEVIADDIEVIDSSEPRKKRNENEPIHEDVSSSEDPIPYHPSVLTRRHYL